MTAIYPESRNRTAQVTAYAVATDFARLPSHVAEQTRKIIFDEIGCAVVRRELTSGRLIADFAGGLSDAAEATIWGSDRKVSAPAAALANGTAGHANEIDGAHVTDGHPGAVMVHAVFAMGQRLHSAGRDVINAVALAYDIGTRLVGALGGAYELRQRHHIHSDYLHGFGAAVTCARLTGLDQFRTAHAAALVAGYSGGLASVFEERRHMSKALSTGQAACAGVTATLLAQLGFEGHYAIFDARHGPLSWAAEDRPHIFSDLGKVWGVDSAYFKFYSAGYPIHAPTEGALELVARNAISLDEIETVRIGLTTEMHDVVNDRKMPSICVQEMVALALAKGGLDFDIAHSATAFRDPGYLALRPRISAYSDPRLDEADPKGRGAYVEIRLQSGASHEIHIPHPKGHARGAVPGWDELNGKFEGMLGRRWGGAIHRDFFGLCQTLEELDDIIDLVRLTERGAARRQTG